MLPVVALVGALAVLPYVVQASRPCMSDCSSFVAAAAGCMSSSDFDCLCGWGSFHTVSTQCLQHACKGDDLGYALNVQGSRCDGFSLHRRNTTRTLQRRAPICPFPDTIPTSTSTTTAPTSTTNPASQSTAASSTTTSPPANSATSGPSSTGGSSAGGSTGGSSGGGSSTGGSTSGVTGGSPTSGGDTSGGSGTPTPKPKNNSAVIGGAVGGVIAGLAIAGLVGFFLMRRRRDYDTVSHTRPTIDTDQRGGPAAFSVYAPSHVAPGSQHDPYAAGAAPYSQQSYNASHPALAPHPGSYGSSGVPPEAVRYNSAGSAGRSSPPPSVYGGTGTSVYGLPTQLGPAATHLQQRLTPAQLNVVQAMIARGMGEAAITDVMERMMLENHQSGSSGGGPGTSDAGDAAPPMYNEPPSTAQAVQRSEKTGRILYPSPGSSS